MDINANDDEKMMNAALEGDGYTLTQEEHDNKKDAEGKLLEILNIDFQYQKLEDLKRYLKKLNDDLGDEHQAEKATTASTEDLSGADMVFQAVSSLEQLPNIEYEGFEVHAGPLGFHSSGGVVQPPSNEEHQGFPLQEQTSIIANEDGLDQRSLLSSILLGEDFSDESDNG